MLRDTHFDSMRWGNTMHQKGFASIAKTYSRDFTKLWMFREKLNLEL